MSDVMEPFPIPAPAFNGRSRIVPAGNAFEWLKQGWALFAVNPGIWIALTIVFIVLILGLSIVPLIGALAANLVTPALAAGMMFACQKAANGDTLEISDLLVGFKQNTNNLIMLGVFYLVGMLILFVIVVALGGGSVAGAFITGSPLAFGGLLLALLLSMVLAVPLAMAMWFAPALVLFNNMTPVGALRASFSACLKNTLVFLVYGLIVMVLLFFATLPAGLGLLVLVPVIAGSTYASYRDIFVAN